jgi:hypothetical protein
MALPITFDGDLFASATIGRMFQALMSAERLKGKGFKSPLEVEIGAEEWVSKSLFSLT